MDWNNETSVSNDAELLSLILLFFFSFEQTPPYLVYVPLHFNITVTQTAIFCNSGTLNIQHTFALIRDELIPITIFTAQNPLLFLFTRKVIHTPRQNKAQMLLTKISNFRTILA